MNNNNYMFPESRQLILSNYIDMDTVGPIIEEIRKINAFDDGNKKIQGYVRMPIEIIINSPGGDVYSAWALIGAIEMSQTPVHTIVSGLAASAGFLIFISGHKRIVHRHATLMIHALSTGYYGQIQELKERMAINDKVQKQIESYIVERTNITQEKLDDIRERKFDWYITAEEAIELDVADELFDPIAEEQKAEELDLEILTDVLSGVNEEIFEQIARVRGYKKEDEGNEGDDKGWFDRTFKR